jgi:Xaa-Pro aminopeptidase
MNPSMDRYAARRDKLRKLIRKANADALLVTSFVNVTYLTGFTGDDSYLIVHEDGELLVTDPRYTEQLESECPELPLEVRRPGVKMLDGTVKAIKSVKAKRLGVEAESITLSLRDAIAEKLPELSIVATKGLVEELRMIKDKQELDEIRRAVWQAEKAFAVVKAMLRPDATERQVANDLEYQMRCDGAKGCSFTPIVGVGPRAALPHGRPTDAKISDAGFVLIDWGTCSGLYMSDLTRVLVTGKHPPKLEKIYKIVLEAQIAAIDAIRPGKKCQEIDKVARDIIAKAGFGKQFGHGLGHGIGLQIHEKPSFGVGQDTVLEPGMTMTVEPGIYLPGQLGVRIEDDIVVTKTGCEVLTHVPKQWENVFV